MPRIARAAAPPESAYHTELVRIVRELLTTNPGPVLSALRQPTIATLLRCLRWEGDESRAPALAREAAALLAFELALSGALPREVKVGRPPERLLSLAHRLAVRLPSDGAMLTIDRARLRVEGREPRVLEIAALLAGSDAAVERPYAAIDRGIVLALADNNPIASVEAHPDKAGNRLDLGGRPMRDWQEALRAAFDLVGRHMPVLRDELDLFVQQIVPVGWDPERHVSASYQEAIGTAYLSLHPDPMTMAEALIHEFSHNKLNALLELDPVLSNGDEVHASPIRPDPRPLRGVLLAVHAFLPVAHLYELMIAASHPFAAREGFVRRYADVRAINRTGAEVLLTHARPTEIGRGLLDEIRRWDDHFANVEG